MGPSAHAGRRPPGVRGASRSPTGLRPTRAEKDALRASRGSVSVRPNRSTTSAEKAKAVRTPSTRQLCYKGQVSIPGERWRAIVPLVAALVVVQGVLGLVPHQHHPGAHLGATPLPAPNEGVGRPQLSPPASESLRVSFCLACVITPSAFAQPDETPSLTVSSSCPASTPLTRLAVCLPRPWRCLQRGPPTVA